MLSFLHVSCTLPHPPNEDRLHQGWCLINVPAADADVIQRAINEWNDRTDKTSWFITESDCDGFIERVPVITGKESWAGVTRSTGKIYYEDWEIPETLNFVMLHELGHAASLEHSPNPLDIMYKSVTDVQHLSDGDLAQFNSYWW